MKVFRSTNETPLESLPKGKVRLTVDGDDPENIWVANDEVNKKMYLLNHAVNFYPVPSWGSEWPLSKVLDIAEARGESPEETVLTFHAEAYGVLEPFITDGDLDLEGLWKSEEDVADEDEASGQ